MSGPHLGRVCMLAWSWDHFFSTLVNHTRAHPQVCDRVGFSDSVHCFFNTPYEHTRVTFNLGDRMMSLVPGFIPYEHMMVLSCFGRSEDGSLYTSTCVPFPLYTIVCALFSTGGRTFQVFLVPCDRLSLHPVTSSFRNSMITQLSSRCLLINT